MEVLGGRHFLMSELTLYRRMDLEMKAPDEGGNMSSESPLAIPSSPLSSPNPGECVKTEPSGMSPSFGPALQAWGCDLGVLD